MRQQSLVLFLLGFVALCGGLPLQDETSGFDQGIDNGSIDGEDRLSSGIEKRSYKEIPKAYHSINHRPPSHQPPVYQPPVYQPHVHQPHVHRPPVHQHIHHPPPKHDRHKPHYHAKVDSIPSALYHKVYPQPDSYDHYQQSPPSYPPPHINVHYTTNDGVSSYDHPSASGGQTPTGGCVNPQPSGNGYPETQPPSYSQQYPPKDEKNIKIVLNCPCESSTSHAEESSSSEEKHNVTIVIERKSSESSSSSASSSASSSSCEHGRNVELFIEKHHSSSCSSSSSSSEHGKNVDFIIHKHDSSESSSSSSSEDETIIEKSSSESSSSISASSSSSSESKTTEEEIKPPSSLPSLPPSEKGIKAKKIKNSLEKVRKVNKITCCKH